MRLNDYWPGYLQHHSHPTNRTLHAAGWVVFLAGAATSAVTARAAPVAVGVVCAYALAWTGHFYFQREAPETFRRPLLANLASLRMFWLMSTGRLEDELRRHLR